MLTQTQNPRPKPNLPPTVLSLYHPHPPTLPSKLLKGLVITFFIGVVLKVIVSGKTLVVRRTKMRIVRRRQHHTNGVHNGTKLKSQNRSLRA
jgi:hypothetical protein